MSNSEMEAPATGHARLERNITLMAIATFVTVAIGGIVEIAPLFWIDNTIEKVDGVRPYTPLELAGRDIYIREGCYVCHSQMIRPFRDEVERYGHYSLAAESMYDHPFQWGSKRTGPDLARVGGRYSDEWHVQHLTNPQAVVPESVMPQYGFLAETELSKPDIADNLIALRRVGVPYTKAQIEHAADDLALVAQKFAAEEERRDPEVMAQPCGGRDSSETFEFRGDRLFFLGGNRGTLQQRRRIVTKGEGLALFHQLVAITLDLAVKVRGSGVGRQEHLVGKVVSGCILQRREVEQGREQDHAVDGHAIAALQVLGEARDSDAAV